MWYVVHILCISLLAVDYSILASSSSISSWHHQHQSYARDISTSSGISNRLYRGSTFAINSRRRSAFVQPSSCFATHYHQTTSARRTKSSVITATLFPIWKQRRSNTISLILNRVGRIEVNSAIPYIDTLSTAEADLDMTADNLLQSATTAVDGLSKLNEGKDDTTVDSSNIDNNANTDESVPLDDKQEDDDIEEAKEEKSILVHTYNSNLRARNADDTTTNSATTTTTATSILNANNNDNKNLTLMGVGMSKRQFAAWVQYYITHMSQDGEVIPTTAQPSTQSTQSATTAAQSAAQGILSRQPQLQQTIDDHEQQTILQQQHLQREANSQTLDNLLQSNQITTESVEYESKVWEEEYIPIIRQYWKNGKLICEHTNILNGRRRPPLDEECSEDGKSREEKLTKEEIQSKKEEETRQYKAEQFRDTLNSYAERLSSIVEDEMSDVDFHPSSTSEAVGSSDQDKRLPFNFGQIVDLPKRTTHQVTQPQHHQHQTLPQWQTTKGLKGWIEDQYGINNTRQLMANVLLSKSEKEQLQTFQTFLDWFRNNFPYFHDKCDSCGSPCKDDPEPHKSDDGIVEKDTRAEGSNNIDEQQTNELVDDQQQEEEEDEDDFSFLGYVYPTPSEQLGNASRTELYQCRTCSSYTRFPRYNKALWVTTTQRGRCGEYSMLLYRMLRVLGYENVRWVVDWADHVWAEVWLGGSSDNTEGSNNGRWVHLDPCEAAVDNPLLYESWGKNQTYIVAFHDPFYTTTSSADLIEEDRRILEAASQGRIPEKSNTYRFPPVEDVTSQYTRDEAHVIEERRGIADDPVAEAINEVSKNMVHLLDRSRTNQLS